MLKHQKRGFTLAETIMTLFIVGLVVTAAIPVFTIKKTNAPAASVDPWYYCDATGTDKLDGGTGLCTAAKVAIPSNAFPSDTAIASQYDFFVNSSNVAPYDIFASDMRSLKIGEYYFNEGNNNLVISRKDTKFSRKNNIANLIIDSGSKNFIDLDDLEGPGGTRYNVSIGQGNKLCNGQYNPKHAVDPMKPPLYCESNVILGNNNTVGMTKGNDSAINNSIIFGENNVIGKYVNSSVVIGAGNTAIDVNANPSSCSSLTGCYPGSSLLVGFDLNLEKIKAENVLDSFFNIGDHIYGTRGDITFAGSINLPSLTVSVPYSLQSDERLKNVKGSYSKGLKEILQVKPVVFAYKSDPAANENVGVIAQDIQNIFPEAVVSMPSGFLGVDTDPMFFAMINSLKEINANAQAEINRQQSLKDELAQLKSELSELSACKANSFIGRIECFFADIKRFFISIAWFTKGEADAKA